MQQTMSHYQLSYVVELMN